MRPRGRPPDPDTIGDSHQKLYKIARKSCQTACRERIDEDSCRTRLQKVLYCRQSPASPGGGVYGGHKSCSRDDFYVFVCVVSDRGVAPRIFPPSAGRLGEAEFGDSFRN